MIRIGPAGFGGNPVAMIESVASYGVAAAEVEFTYGVRMKQEDARTLGKLNKKYNLMLSIHAPYYINLASKEKEKIEASKKRIIDSCDRGRLMGAKYVVFHAGFYQGRDKEEVFQMIKEGIIDIQQIIKKNRWNITLAPETTGKESQFGDIDELIRMKKETGCHLCVDFAHLKARNRGKIDYDEIMNKLKPLGHIHAHFSGIEWTDKGERRHLITPEKEIKELLSYLLKYNIDVTIINESPDSIGDSVKTLKILEDMGGVSR